MRTRTKLALGIAMPPTLLAMPATRSRRKAKASRMRARTKTALRIVTLPAVLAAPAVVPVAATVAYGRRDARTKPGFRLLRKTARSLRAAVRDAAVQMSQAA